MMCPKCGLRPETLVVIPHDPQISGKLMTDLMRHVVKEEIEKGNCPQCIAYEYAGATIAVSENGILPLVPENSYGHFYKRVLTACHPEPIIPLISRSPITQGD